jgi:hypothetical protein
MFKFYLLEFEQGRKVKILFARILASTKNCQILFARIPARKKSENPFARILTRKKSENPIC